MRHIGDGVVIARTTGPGRPRHALWAIAPLALMTGLLTHAPVTAATSIIGRTWPIAAVLIIGLPLLAQWLFGAALHWDVPALRGFNFRGGMVLIPELAALTLALSVYTSAFIAEIIRAGIQAVPYGQHEAARSLGTFVTVICDDFLAVKQCLH